MRDSFEFMEKEENSKGRMALEVICMATVGCDPFCQEVLSIGRQELKINTYSYIHGYLLVSCGHRVRTVQVFTQRLVKKKNDHEHEGNLVYMCITYPMTLGPPKLIEFVVYTPSHSNFFVDPFPWPFRIESVFLNPFNRWSWFDFDLPTMTLMVLFGTAFIAFSMPAAIFLLIVRKSAKLVIVMYSRYAIPHFIVTHSWQESSGVVCPFMLEFSKPCGKRSSDFNR